ncbi:MAG TPA: peptide ABC transporter substrate-binding protein [Steroidobacteraceae bacterium]|nr:peptide ABC transporter substrate-binding protein [Steroidobacteraceae bacterium]
MRLDRRLACAALAAALALGGCHRAPPADAVGGSAAAGVLRRGNGPEPDSLDPQLARTDSAANILRDAYEGLATLDARAEPVPGAASSWRVSDDGLIYTFTLRPDARWSNGEPVVAQDFVASWRRLVDPGTGSQYADVLQPVVNAADIVARKAPPATLGAAAPDPHTLIVRLRAPTPYFPGLVAHWSTFPTYHGAAPLPAGRTVSNGAYTLGEWIVGSHVTLRRNPLYWNAAATRIETVKYFHVADANDEYARYRGGDLDATYALPQQPLARLEAAHPGEIHRTPQLGVYYYGFNLAKPPFRDAPGLRQALAMTVDRERLVASVTGLGELPAYSWVPPGIANYATQRFAWAGQPYPERIAMARRLYAAAGYSSSRPLTVELRFPSGATHERIALAVAAMWKEALGVQTRLVGEEFKSLLQTINRGETQLFRASWIGDYNDAWTFAEVLSGGFGINLPGYQNAAYDAALSVAANATDPAARRAALEGAERTMLADAPVVPLYFYVNKHLVAPRLRGWHDNVMNVVYTKDLALAR